MRRIWFRMATAVAATCLASTGANAALDVSVPDNATVMYNGLQWAWASPLGPFSVDLSYQGSFGWHLPTPEELAMAPGALQFIYEGANVPLGGVDPLSGANWQFVSGTLDGSAALATPYFSDSYLHGDWCNGQGSACGFGELAWNGNSVNETLVVRSVGAVPEPATWAMMLMGIGGMGAAMRRSRRKAPQVRFQTA